MCPRCWALRQGAYGGFSGGPVESQGSLIVEEVGRRERVSGRCSGRKTGEAGSWECWQPLEAGKGKETDSFLESPEGLALPTP